MIASCAGNQGSLPTTHIRWIKSSCNSCSRWTDTQINEAYAYDQTRIQTHKIFKIKSRGSRGDSEVKNTACSLGGPRFTGQHPYDSTLTATIIQEVLVPSSSLHGNHMHVSHWHACVQNKIKNKTNQNDNVEITR